MNLTEPRPLPSTLTRDPTFTLQTIMRKHDDPGQHRQNGRATRRWAMAPMTKRNRQQRRRGRRRRAARRVAAVLCHAGRSTPQSRLSRQVTLNETPTHTARPCARETLRRCMCTYPAGSWSIVNWQLCVPLCKVSAPVSNESTPQHRHVELLLALCTGVRRELDVCLSFNCVRS